MKTNKQAILIVDDEPAMLELVQEVLLSAGYEVFTADNANDALRLALAHSPVLAILDIHMPDINGLTLAQSLADETSVPFVFFTRDARRDEVQQATHIGAIGYLTKPVNPDQIVPFVSVSLARAEEISRLKKREAHLQTAVEASRIIGAAVGLLMAKHPLNESQAFQRLHDHARSKRQKIVDIARALVNAQENVNLM